MNEQGQSKEKTTEELDKILTREFLIQEHHVKEKNLNQIGKEIGCSSWSVVRRLKRFNIKIHDWVVEKIDNILTESFLKKEISLNKDITQISKETNTSFKAIEVRLKKYGLVIPLSKWDKLITKEFLILEYINKIKSKKELAEYLGCDPSVISRKLKEFNIPIRNNKEASTSKVRSKIAKTIHTNKERGIKISKSLKGRIFSKEHKLKISKSNKGKLNTKEHNLKIGKAITGRILSEETKQKISRALKGRKRSEICTKKILASVCASPNKFENECLVYLNTLYPNKFRFIGNGSILINGRSPDFIDEESKIVVLANGLYYHLKQFDLVITEENKRKREQIEGKPFIEMGYKVWFIWEKDIYNIIKY